MLIFINTPGLAMSLGLRTLDEGVRESRKGHRTGERAEPTSGRNVTGRRGWRLARSLRIAH